MLEKEAKTVLDTAKWCEYDLQMTVVNDPLVWVGKADPFLLHRNDPLDQTNCQAVVKDALKLYDPTSFVDSMEMPIGLCCAEVHKFYTCVGNKQEVIDKDADGLRDLDRASFSILGAYASYCVPLFKYPTKEEFCAQYPESDPCITYYDCEDCVDHGGTWCANGPKKNTCGAVGSTECGSYNAKTRIDCQLCCGAPPPEQIKIATTTTTTTTTTPVPRTPYWWWELVHNETYYAAKYIPDKTVDIAQGEPAMYRPFGQ
jgi:hypothetical protein